MNFQFISYIGNGRDFIHGATGQTGWNGDTERGHVKTEESQRHRRSWQLWEKKRKKKSVGSEM